MNLGCGTLIFLMVLVGLAGQLIPHGKSVSTSVPQQRNESQASVPPVKKSPVHQGNSAAATQAVSPTVQLAPEGAANLSLEGLLSGLKGWIDERAKAAENRAGLPPASGPAVEVLAKAGEEVKAAVAGKIAETVARSALNQVSSSEQAAKSQKSESPSMVPATKAAPGALPPGGRMALEGKDPVFNNPWNQAVEPVERYLKQHVHDATSIEILEWGHVEALRDGYQVRCIYKSKNVLGKMTTQSRLFIMNHEGKVVDIKD